MHQYLSVKWHNSGTKLYHKLKSSLYLQGASTAPNCDDCIAAPHNAIPIATQACADHDVSMGAGCCWVLSW